jgi:hypothetical protein
MDLVERHDAETSRHPWEVSRARFFVHLLDRMASGSDPVRWLDVGSGDAFLAEELLRARPAGSAITCWDVNYTEDELEGELAAGLTLTAEEPAGAFAGVLMLDVVEHVEDDVGFVSSVTGAHLADEGFLLVSVPAYQSLFTAHDTALKHYRRYSPRQCRDVLVAAGFTVMAEGGLFHSLLPVRALQAGSERLRRPADDAQKGIGAWNRGERVTRALTGCFDLEARASLYLGTKTRAVVPGLSYWAFCRRSEGDATR